MQVIGDSGRCGPSMHLGGPVVFYQSRRGRILLVFAFLLWEKVNHEKPQKLEWTLNFFCLHNLQVHGAKWSFDLHFLKLHLKFNILANNYYKRN